MTKRLLCLGVAALLGLGSCSTSICERNSAACSYTLTVEPQYIFKPSPPSSLKLTIPGLHPENRDQLGSVILSQDTENKSPSALDPQGLSSAPLSGDSILLTIKAADLTGFQQGALTVTLALRNGGSATSKISLLDAPAFTALGSKAFPAEPRWFGPQPRTASQPYLYVLEPHPQLPNALTLNRYTSALNGAITLMGPDPAFAFSTFLLAKSGLTAVTRDATIYAGPDLCPNMSCVRPYFNDVGGAPFLLPAPPSALVANPSGALVGVVSDSACTVLKLASDGKSLGELTPRPSLPPKAQVAVGSRDGAEVVAVLSSTGPQAIFYAEGKDGALTSTSAAFLFDSQRDRQIADPTSLALGDLNGDGRTDLVYSANNQVYWLAGLESGAFFAASDPIKLPGDPSVAALALVDLDGDRRLDLVLRSGATLSFFRTTP